MSVPAGDAVVRPDCRPSSTTSIRSLWARAMPPSPLPKDQSAASTSDQYRRRLLIASATAGWVMIWRTIRELGVVPSALSESTYLGVMGSELLASSGTRCVAPGRTAWNTWRAEAGSSQTLHSWELSKSLTADPRRLPGTETAPPM